MMIIFVRIILTWFSWERNSGLSGFLSGITDPYLNWFRRFKFLRAGFIDFSPIAALGILSLVNRVFSILASYGTITLGTILALLVQLIWGVVSFVLGFLFIIMMLCLVAHLTSQNKASSFWRIIDSIAQPVLYRVNRLLFKDRIVSFRTGLFVTIGGLGTVYMLLKLLVVVVSGMLANLPV